MCTPHIRISMGCQDLLLFKHFVPTELLDWLHPAGIFSWIASWQTVKNEDAAAFLGLCTTDLVENKEEDKATESCGHSRGHVTCVL